MTSDMTMAVLVTMLHFCGRYPLVESEEVGGFMAF
jgi:hypothetical protein